MSLTRQKDEVNLIRILSLLEDKQHAYLGELHGNWHQEAGNNFVWWHLYNEDNDNTCPSTCLEEEEFGLSNKRLAVVAIEVGDDVFLNRQNLTINTIDSFLVTMTHYHYYQCTMSFLYCMLQGDARGRSCTLARQSFYFTNKLLQTAKGINFKHAGLLYGETSRIHQCFATQLNVTL